MSPAHARATEGGDALVGALARHGVRSLFSISGGPINSAYFATTRHDVRIVHTRHEAAAGFMADAVYRSTGEPGVVLATLGPGAMNTVTPAACALAAGVPMLIIGGQASTAQLHRGAGMEFDTLTPLAAVTKWAAQVLHADRIEEFVDEAWNRMMSGTPGPVYLEIPTNVLSAPVEVDPARSLRPRATAAAPSVDAIGAAAEQVRAARRPILLAGDGVFHDDSADLLREFVARTGLPVSTLRLGRGAIDEVGDQHWFGPGYVPANPVLGEALAEADLVVLLGHHWEFDLEFGAGIGPDTSVVQVHRDAAQLGRNGRVDLAICSDVGPFLRALDEVDAEQLDPDWVTGRVAAWQRHQDSITEDAAVEVAEDARAHPIRVVDAVVQAAPAEARFVTSHGNIDFWADPRIPVRRPQSYLRTGQSGALGAELPYAVGTALEDPSAPTIVFVGDGAVGYHISELETAARFGAPVIVVVLDDSSWGAIAMPQRMSYDVEVAMSLPSRDWATVATGLGCAGVTATADTVGAAISDAVRRDGPTLIQVPVRPTLSHYMAHIS
ncbi:MAG: thiamine pyrophosphate-binding protein [Propionibacteriaceae bacterium]